MTETALLRRHRAAGDDVHGARRPVSGRRPQPHPDRRQADRAAGRMPAEPRGAAGPRRAAGCQAPRLRDDRDGDHRRNAACLRVAGCEDRAGTNAGSTSRRRSPRRTSITGSRSRTSAFISRPTGARSAPTGRACRRCPTTCRRSDEATPDRPFRMVTAPARQFPQYQLHRDADIAAAGRSADRAAASGGRGARSASPMATACGSAMRAARSCCMRVCSTDCSRASWWRKASGRTRRSKAASASTR